jgi:hypothetical protein
MHGRQARTPLRLIVPLVLIGKGAALTKQASVANLRALRIDTRTSLDHSLELDNDQAFNDASVEGSIEGPWRAGQQVSDSSNRNMCDSSKQLPDIYVLGVQKCATSSFANDLMAAGVKNVHGDLNPKEFHWFDHRMDYSLVGEDAVMKNKQSWLEWMPSCPSNGSQAMPRREVLADFTPDYLRVVPLPQDLVPVGDGWLDSSKAGANMPKAIVSLYGADQAKRLSFVVLLRDPISQMQSAWYHAQSFDFLNACKSCRAENFSSAFELVVKGLQSNPPQYTPWLWTVLYARQLEEWLNHFDASQLYVVPTREYTEGDKDAICQDLSERLEFPIDCNSGGVAATHIWSHEHPRPEVDAGSFLIAEFERLMAKEQLHLVDLLTKANGGGARLAGYTGAVGDNDAIKQWLLSHW